ncbi:cation/calcium exchanger [Salix suchowensis]|nr:cation/calcium exchanger [Salix suchowensis]
MAIFSTSRAKPKKSTIFLNISFIFLFLFYIATSYFLDQSNEPEVTAKLSLRPQEGLTKIEGCSGIHDYTDYKSKCVYIKSNIGCRSKGYINYLQIFYCTCGKFSMLGHAMLLLWLAVLFYLLGNTAADYFCPSLESLSKLLKLSPTIAGVTLLSLGNGAPDVFASIVSFTRSSNGDVGLNSILGGAFFVSSVVVGVISILTSPRQISVDKCSFIRDVCFFLFSLCCLLLIIRVGKISLWGAISFLAIYLGYVSVVCIMHCQYRKKNHLTADGNQEEFLESGIPLLGYVDDEKPVSVDKTTDKDQQSSSIFCNLDSSLCYYSVRLLYVLELPLYFPRRLTIPVVSEERWSRPFAVISVALAPILLAALCTSQSEKEFGSKSSLVTYMISGLVGIVLGNLAYVTTKKSSPPKKSLLPWLAGGFFMSVTWSYIIAEELVSLLISLGIDCPGLGQFPGDLIANVAMAVNGGADGAQIAISGCYAGPMFNMLLGLGISLIISSGSKYPSSFVIPEDPSLYETLGFLIGSLLWSLVILPRKNMRLDRSLGIGLLAIYLCFLSLRLARSLGLLKLH